MRPHICGLNSDNFYTIYLQTFQLDSLAWLVCSNMRCSNRTTQLYVNLLLLTWDLLCRIHEQNNDTSEFIGFPDSAVGIQLINPRIKPTNKNSPAFLLQTSLIASLSTPICSQERCIRASLHIILMFAKYDLSFSELFIRGYVLVVLQVLGLQIKAQNGAATTSYSHQLKFRSCCKSPGHL